MLAHLSCKLQQMSRKCGVLHLALDPPLQNMCACASLFPCSCCCAGIVFRSCSVTPDQLRCPHSGPNALRRIFLPPRLAAMWIWVWPCWGKRTTWGAPCVKGKQGWVGWVTYPALPGLARLTAVGGHLLLRMHSALLAHPSPAPHADRSALHVESSRLFFFHYTHTNTVGYCLYTSLGAT